MATQYCPGCKRKVADTKKTCPKCGGKKGAGRWPNYKSYLFYISSFAMLALCVNFVDVLSHVFHDELDAGDAIYMFFYQSKDFLVFAMIPIYALLNHDYRVPGGHNTKLLFNLVAKFMLPVSLTMDAVFAFYNFCILDLGAKIVLQHLYVHGKLSILLIGVAVVLYFINKRRK